MKRIYSLVLANLLAPLILSAAPCVPGLLSSYIGASCTNFGITFDTWTYAAGGSALLSSDVSVFPSVANPVFEFTAFDRWTAGPGVTITPSIGFHATATSPAILGSMLFLAFGVVEGSGTGSVTVTMSECLNGLLPVCSPGTSMSLTTSLTSGSSDLFKTNSFGTSPATVDVRNLFTIVGGTTGAKLQSIESGFGVVPEPLTMELTLLGGLLIVASRRWTFR